MLIGGDRVCQESVHERLVVELDSPWDGWIYGYIEGV